MNGRKHLLSGIRRRDRAERRDARRKRCGRAWAFPFRLRKAPRRPLAVGEEPLATDLQDKPPPLGAWVALFRDDRGETREAAAGRVQGAHPWRRAREASHRACAAAGRGLASPRRPAVPAGVKNGVTRSERGGHLQPLGTSTERVRAEEERCASAPKTVPGNSHLTGEASPSSPEVWRFCAAGEEAAAAAAAAEAAECLPIPGCEAVCWLASDPRPGAKKGLGFGRPREGVGGSGTRSPEAGNQPARLGCLAAASPAAARWEVGGIEESWPGSRRGFWSPVAACSHCGGRGGVGPQNHHSLEASSINLKKKIICNFHFNKVLYNVLKRNYKE
ncbi:hypothetical protein R6Z07F_018220 [Ovis aries]